QLPVIPLEPHGVAAATPRELLQFRPRLIIHHISAAPPCKLGFWPGFREDRRRSVLEYVSTGPQRKRSQNPRSQGVLSRCDESLEAAAWQPKNGSALSRVRRRRAGGARSIWYTKTAADRLRGWPS